jgi:hypothetical protein
MLTLLIPISASNETDVFCECFPFNPKSIKGLKTRSDLIAIGKPIEKITVKTDYEEEMIVFEIDSLIKGNTAIHTILINQNNAGNCAENFELCTEYLITGDQIKNVKATYRMGQTDHSVELEKLVSENYSISTSGCRSFALKSSFAEQFLSEKN